MIYRIFLLVLIPLTAFAETSAKIGVILPLTGEAASYGEQFERGIKLNPKASNFELIFEDSKFDSKTALGAFHKLVDVDHVSFLVSFGGATCQVLNEQARAHHLLHVAAGCNTAEFTDPDSSNFRLDVNEAVAAEQTALYLKKSGFRNIALLYVNNSWGGTIIKYTKDAFSKAGLNAVADIPFDQTRAGDLRSDLARIRKSGAEVIFMISLPNLTPFVLKQIHEIGLSPVPIMSNISVENPDVIRLSGQNAEGIFYLSVKPKPESRRQFTEFYSAFPDGNPFAAWGFDSISLLSYAEDKESPNHALQGLRNFLGAFNSYTFNSSGELNLTYEIREIKDGKYVWRADL